MSRMLVYVECADSTYITAYVDDVEGATADDRERNALHAVAAKYARDNPMSGIAIDVDDPRLVHRQISAHTETKVQP